tara:strand:- start:433 stop:627 length:195 start_codon:yes stop_codon:yes gene_type:complete
MAYIQKGYCKECEKDVDFINGLCTICCERIRRETMAKWQSNTVEEKLLDLHKRTLKLEQPPATY